MGKTFKKFAALLLAAAIMIPSGWLVAASAAAAPDIPVILYHRILASGGDDYTTSVSEFQKQMKYLSDNGYNTLSADQYVDILKGKATAPDKPILLTFDDGTPDFAANALPVLKEHGMKSVAFIVTDWIGGGYSMTAKQLEALAKEPSVSLQNHTKTHDQAIWTSNITAAQAKAEIVAASASLKSVTGKNPVLLAYPYGAFNAAAQQAAKDNGMLYAFKVGTPNSGDFALGRHMMMNNTKLSQFAAMVGGPAPADQPVEVTVYHETFASGAGKAVQAGSAALAQVSDKAFEGNDDGKALSVAKRKDNWDGVDLKFSDLGLKNGKTYSVSVSLFVDSGVTVPDGAQAFLQTVNSYGWLGGANFEAGKALTLTGKLTVDESKDVALRIQSNDAGKAVPFYVGDILITGEASGVPGYEESFASGKGAAKPAGNPTVAPVAGKKFEGNDDGAALFISGRTNNWDGIDFAFGDIGLKNGVTYSITVNGYVDENVKVPAGAQAFLQTVDSYSWLAGANFVAGEAFTLTGQLTVDGSKDVALRIQSNDAGKEVPFYVGEVSIVGPGQLGVQKDLTPIKDAYKDKFLIGNAVSDKEFEGDRLELLALHHNVVTAENAMKPDQAYDANRKFDFTDEDKLVGKIEAAGLKLHGHVLVWHQQTPEWLSTTTDAQNKTVPLSREQALANMRTHIRTVMEHFGNKVISWDVVNEAMNDNPPNPTDWQAALRQSSWYAAIGPDYVEQAFLAAREVLDAHPSWDIKLYYNDYNDDNQNKSTAIASMVKDLNDKYAQTHPGKLLIDGVGMQGHYNAKTNPANVEASLEKFIALGVEVSVSELDITAGSNAQISEKEAIAQGYLYAKLFSIYKAHADHIARVTFWGLNDSSSWRASDSPLPFDKDLQAKQAYYAIMDPDKYMSEHPPVVTEVRQSTAVYGTPVIDGKVDAIWKDAPAMPLNRYQTAWQGATGTAKALWDDRYLYVLLQVTDQQLDKGSANAWEQDSIEVFLDQNNEKSSSYQSDDGQYRVNYKNETSFNPPSIAEGFSSAVKVSGTNYTVEVKIPLSQVTPANGAEIGFDAQINDAKDGARQSVAAWNDLSGNGYQDPSVFGVLKLTGKPDGRFNDLRYASWAREAIEQLAELGVVNGTGAHTFAPAAAVKQADFVAMLDRALKLGDQAGKLSAALPDGASPNGVLSRQEMMTLTAEALKAAGKTLAADGSLDAFPDASSVANYAKDSVAALVKAGIVNGKDGNLAPNDSLTRAEAAVIVYRILNL